MNKNLSKAFRARNARFNAATLAEKRVIIAKDVIAQISKKTMIPKEGAWVRINAENKINGYSIAYPNGKASYELNDAEKQQAEDIRNEQICDLVGAQGVSCTVCALGSLMLSLVRYRNNVTVRDFEQNAFEYDRIHRGNEDKTGITKYFTNAQRILIESAFEKGCGFFRNDRNISIGEKKVARAVKFGEKYEDKTKRLVAIMKNIVTNNGIFKP